MHILGSQLQRPILSSFGARSEGCLHPLHQRGQLHWHGSVHVQQRGVPSEFVYLDFSLSSCSPPRSSMESPPSHSLTDPARSCTQYMSKATCIPAGVCFWDVRRAKCVSGAWLLSASFATHHHAGVVSDTCSCSADATTLTKQCSNAGWTTPDASSPDRLYAVVETAWNASRTTDPIIAGGFGCYLQKSSDCPCNYDSLVNTDLSYRMCSVGLLV
jgi:hypothetical protein